MNRRRPKICIIAQNAYGALCGGGHGHVGGAEHQTTLLARWLSKNGFQTSLITWDEGQPDGVVVDGIRVFKLCGADQGVPVLRFFYPRLTSLFGAMGRADADVYYHNSAEYVTGLAARWARFKRRTFVYTAAAELACDVRVPLMPKFYERLLYRHGIRSASSLIVQTKRQYQLLLDGYGLKSHILPMPCPGPGPDEQVSLDCPKSPKIAWVGRVSPEKRMEWLIAVAQEMPDYTFEVAAAGSDNSSYTRDLRDKAKALPNINWHGAVARNDIPKLFESSSCLLCTSEREGFPNTFLEAWSYGKPVVTSFDPDGVVQRLGLGSFADSIPKLVENLREIHGNTARWRACSERSRSYFLKKHHSSLSLPRFGDALIDVWENDLRVRE